MEQTTTPPPTTEPTADFLSNIEALATPIYDKLNTPTPEPPKPDTKPAATPPPPPDNKPAPAAPAEDDMPEAIRKSPKASEHWKAKDEKHKKELTEFSTKLSQYEKDLADYKARPAKEDYEKLAKERDEISKAFKLAAIDKHPEFVAKYEQPMQNLVALAKQAAGEHGTAVEKLLKLPDNEYRTEQLDKIMDELSPSKANMLGAVLANVAQLQMAREAEMKEPEKIIAAMEAERARALEAEKAMLTGIFERTIKNASEGETAVAAFQERKDDPKWNEGVRERREMARAIYEGQVSPEERASAALWGAVAPALMEQAAAQAALLKQKDEEIASLKSARPKLEGEDNTRTTNTIDENANVLDRILGIASNSGFVK